MVTFLLKNNLDVFKSEFFHALFDLKDVLKKRQELYSEYIENVDGVIRFSVMQQYCMI